jgi:hypothetical protein
MKAPAIALTGVFEYGSGRIGSVVRMVGDLTGPKPFRLSAPITPFCPEAVSPRALGCFRVSQKLGQRDLLWLTRGMLAGGHLFQPAAPSGYSDSSPPNSAPDFMSATLFAIGCSGGDGSWCDVRVVKQKPGTKTLGY